MGKLQAEKTLLGELLGAVEEQLQEDGHFRTPLDADTRRRDILTRRWEGTAIAAKVIDGGYTDITKHGVYEDDGDNNFEAVRFRGTLGVIQTVSPAYGGYIELDNGTCISLKAQGSRGQLPEGYNPGILITELN